MRFVRIRGLYKKKWKLLALHISQSIYRISAADVKTVQVPRVEAIRDVDVKCLNSRSKNMRKYIIYIKSAQNSRCISSICQESVCKV